MRGPGSKVAIIVGIVALATLFYRYRYPLLRVPTAAQLAAAFPQGTRDIFEHSDKFELLSLDPRLGYDGRDAFHGFRILGRTTIADDRTRRELIRHYYDGLADTGFSAACFNPRHGIRATRRRRILDIAICFSCWHVAVYAPNAKEPAYVHLGKSPKSTFDNALQVRGISLSSY
jgi:hypothetical protein